MHHAARLHPSTIESPRARLLVVEDEQLLRELYGRVLSMDGYEVETAADGVEGLEWLALQHFDLILTDWHMPRLDGASMLLAIRSAGSGLPVIMNSASIKFKSLPARIWKELSATLPKPAGRTELLKAVAAALLGAPLSPAQQRDRANYARPMDLAAV